MPDFINTEHCVEKLFPVGTTFSFEGKKYQVALCGKPRPARGECKTDVYILEYLLSFYLFFHEWPDYLTTFFFRRNMHSKIHPLRIFIF